MEHFDNLQIRLQAEILQEYILEIFGLIGDNLETEDCRSEVRKEFMQSHPGVSIMLFEVMYAFALDEWINIYTD